MPPNYAYRKNYQQDRRLKNIEKRVKKLQDETETKYCVRQGTIAASPAGNVQTLNEGISSGTTRINRIGQQITATSLKLRGYVIPSSNQYGNSVVRIIIFWWNDPLAGLATPVLAGNTLTADDEAMLATQGTAGGSSLVQLPYSMETHQLFTVLYDKVHTATAPQFIITPAQVGPPPVNPVLPTELKFFKVHCKFNRKINYNGTSGNLNTMVGNGLFIAAISDHSTNPSVSYISRFCYKDS